MAGAGASPARAGGAPRPARTRLGQSVQRLRFYVRDVAGRSGPALAAILVEHLGCALEGVQFAEEVVAGAHDRDDIEPQIRLIEQRGDELRQRLVAELSEAIVTPLDREDLFRLSRSIDDVLDNVRDFVREWRLYRPTSPRNLAAVLATLREGIEALSAGVGAIARNPASVGSSLLSAKHHANEVRRHFQREVATLFAEELSVELLKHRELLRRLDVVGLRFGEAVDVLFDALVKRGEGFFLSDARR
ncbi:MAG TPA: DUF47 family protein [Acidimicrobiales bacterium]|nr:DUF47 family protein [Acidimicrobiales bacterium]